MKFLRLSRSFSGDQKATRMEIKDIIVTKKQLSTRVHIILLIIVFAIVGIFGAEDEALEMELNKVHENIPRYNFSLN